jgi:hypothetical protein
VISHEVKFVISSTGTISPSWKLSRVFTVNQSGTFFTAQRNRTSDLTITLGPTNEAKNGPALVPADFALSSQIGTAIANALRTAPP